MKLLAGRNVVVRSVEAGVFVGVLTSIEATPAGVVCYSESGWKNIQAWSSGLTLNEVAAGMATIDRKSRAAVNGLIIGVCEVLLASDKLVTQMNA